MRLKYFVLSLVVMCCTKIAAQVERPVIAFDIQGKSDMVLGVSTNELLPLILRDKPDGKLRLSIHFIAMTNVVRYSWLKITNQVGSKVRLWKTNGVEVPLKDSSALAAWKLPLQTTVSNIMEVVPYRRRGDQWWSYGWAQPGNASFAYEFILQPLFGIPITNDVIVELSPLIYKANMTNQDVQLIEFPPIRFKVKGNGDIEKVDSEGKH